MRSVLGRVRSLFDIQIIDYNIEDATSGKLKAPHVSALVCIITKVYAALLRLLIAAAIWAPHDSAVLNQTP
jgi:hypothetical protein